MAGCEKECAQCPGPSKRSIQSQEQMRSIPGVLLYRARVVVQTKTGFSIDNDYTWSFERVTACVFYGYLRVPSVHCTGPGHLQGHNVDMYRGPGVGRVQFIIKLKITHVKNTIFTLICQVK